MNFQRPFHRSALSLLVACGLAAIARAQSPADWLPKNLPNLVEFYRDLHAHPELSFHEEQTAAQLAKALRDTGMEVTERVGGFGLVAIAKNGPGPTVMVRGDMDALPVEEQTGLVYASKVRVEDADGREVALMHACGHDVHVTCLVGVARYLMTHKDQWSGTLMMIGQPAEERGRGADMMLKAGLFEKFPKPDFGLALHVDSTLETGKVGYRGGYLLANVDSVDVTLKGRGGHGAYPHTTIDPIVMAAQLIVDLQTLVSRETKPTDPAVVTVGSIHGGSKHNIIPNECHLQLTVRSYSQETRDRLINGIKRKAAAVAAGAGAPEPVVDVSDESTPSLFNDEALVERLVPVWKRTLGDDNVVPSEPSMGGEDFSRYGLAGVPICMFRLGAVEAKRLAGLTRGGMQPPSLHSPLFYPDAEETLSTGVTAMVAAIESLMPPASAKKAN
jgi:hippurate hydrolase